MVELSIIMPAYNEEENIQKAIRDINESILTKIPSELIVVEDASTDRTKEILRNLSKELGIKALLRKKKGCIANAILDGIRESKGKFMLSIDSDGQYDPESFWDLWKVRGSADVVIGWRKERHDAMIRKVMPKVYYQLARIFFRCPKFDDMTSPFRLFNRKAAEMILRDFKYEKYSFWGEFALRSWKKGLGQVSVPIVHLDRSAGKSRLFSPARIPVIVGHHLASLTSLWKEFYL